MQRDRIKAGIIGVTGHTGEELLRILLRHRYVDITYLSSSTKEAFPVSAVYPWAKEELAIEPFDIEKAKECDCVFLALPHTVSMDYAEKILPGPKVIDLSADFRFKDASVYKKWYGKETNSELCERAVYGLPEVFAGDVMQADLIANPGCYPTAVLLGLFPLVKNGLFKECLIDAKSGASGAGRKINKQMMFVALAENLYPYKIDRHQHSPEMAGILGIEESSLVFIPHIVGIKRGILADIYVELAGRMNETRICGLYEDFYKGKPFVRIVKEPPKLSDVRNTNYCFIYIKSLSNGRILIVSAIDNIVKGASGQAIQNMNLLFNFPEEEGLL